MIDAIIITGAGQGIGKETALRFGKSGIPVLCISKTENARKTAETIVASGGIADSLVLDISDYGETEKMIKEWAEKVAYNKLGVVLAAAVLGPLGPLDKSSLTDWEYCFRVNVLGNLAVLHGLESKMLRQRFGRIVTFSGGGSAYAYPLFPAYSATKTAMVRITENIDEDLKGKGDFAIVCLAPGANETNLLKQVEAAGGSVRTKVNISEPVDFIEAFMNASACNFSGAFVHVRDTWKFYLNTGNHPEKKELWKLRRIE